MPETEAAFPDSAPFLRRQALVVLGMHRSGTSLMAALLCMAGADRPRNMIAPGTNRFGGNEFNETGHWEPWPLNRLNDEVLAEVKSSWYSTLTFPQGFFGSAKADKHKAKFVDLLREEYGESSLFCVKDPRLARLLPLMLDAMNQESVEPRLILMARNPLEVAESLKNRDGFHSSKSMLLWLRHMLEAEQYSRTLPRVFVTYDDVMSDWRAVLGRIGRQLEISWPRRIADIDVDFESIIAARLRHHRYESTTDARDDVAPWVADVYKAYLSAAKVNEHDLSVFDRVRAELAEADKVFEPLFIIEERRFDEARIESEGEFASIRAQVNERDDTVAAVRDECDTLRAQVGELHTRLYGLDAELAAAKAEAAIARQRYESRSAEVVDAVNNCSVLRVHADELQAQLDAALSELQAANSDIATAREKSELQLVEVAELRSQYSALRVHTDELQTRLSAALAEVEAAKGDAETARAQSDSYSIALATAIETSEARLRQAEVLENQLNVASTELTAARDEVSLIRTQLSARENELSRIRDESSSLRHSVEASEKGCALQKEEAAELRRAIAQRAESAEQLHLELVQTRRESASWRERFEAASALTEELQAELSSRAGELQRLERLVQMREGELAAVLESTALLEARFAEQSQTLRTDLSARADDLRQSRSALSSAETRVTVMAAQIAALKAELATGAEEMSRLRNEIADLRSVEGATRAQFLAATRSADSARADAAAARSLIASLHGKMRTLSDRLWERLDGDDDNSLSEVQASAGSEIALSPLSGETLAHIAAVRHSGLFDAEWYLAQYPDAAQSGLEPLEHYFRFGAQLSYDPGPAFETSYYLRANFDVANSGMNPLAHYALYGIGEGRQPRAAPSGVGEQFSSSEIDPYTSWLHVNGRSDTEERRLRNALAGAGSSLPLISVIMPVFKPPVSLLEDAIASVFAQIYENWELCIHIDGDNDSDLKDRLRALAQRDNRVRLSCSDTNGGISASTNAAAALAMGEFLAFFDQDDLLTPDALAHIVFAAVDNPNADIVYSDDDKISESGNHYAPQFKPDWAPILLLSYMYMSHLFVVRRAIFEELGGFRRGFEGSQDYDFALRASEKARMVAHVPNVLYHWRAIAGSTASSADAKPHSFAAGLRAVQEACDRRGIDATAIQQDWAVAAKVGIFNLRFNDVGPRVTIVIPTRNKLDLLRPCIKSIERLTTYRNFDILIVDNESDDPDTLSYLSSCGHQVVRIGSPDRKFNFAHLMNKAVEKCNGEFVLLLNNDTLVRRGDWLSQMVGYAQMDGVGAVGAKLYFPDDTIQHAGIVHGFYGGLAGPAFRNAPAWDHGYLGYSMVAREYSAVTAACLLTKRSVFLSIGGMDEKTFAVAYNDVDFCYRLVQAGYTCVYCPEAELTHFEGKSRGFDDNALEVSKFRSRYRNFKDRWYSQHLTLDDERFGIEPSKYALAAVLKSPLRIAMFSHNLNHEGAPNSMFELVAGLKAKGYVDPVVIAPENGPIRSYYEQAGIPVQIIDHPLRDGFDPEVYVPRVERIGAMLRESGAELVYANTAQMFWALDAARRADLPAVWNIRESEPWNTYYQWLPQFLQYAAYESFYSAYRVIFVASSTRSGWSPLSGRRNFKVIQNGLDLNRLRVRSAGMNRTAARQRLGVAEHEVVIVLVGTVCERKNQRVLLQAIDQMPVEMAANVRVFIVGDRESDYSRALHEDWAGLPPDWKEKVEIVPETDKPYTYFFAADVSVCTSLVESYPRVVLEAMAVGLPLVTTPVFGITEQAHANVNALFFEPLDSTALKDALVELVSKDALRRSFSKNSSTLFEGLMQYDDMIERYAAIMREAALSTVSPLMIDFSTIPASERYKHGARRILDRTADDTCVVLPV